MRSVLFHPHQSQVQETVKQPLIRVTPQTTRTSVRDSQSPQIHPWPYSTKHLVNNQVYENSLRNTQNFHPNIARGNGKNHLDGKVSLLSVGRVFPNDRVDLLNEDPTINGKSFKLVCYYGSWSYWRRGPGKLSVSSIDPFACTHLIYSFVRISSNFTLVSHDPYLDLSGKDSGGGRRISGYSKAVGLKKVNPALKVMFSVGGWDAGSQIFSDLTSKRDSRKTFIKSLQSFLKEHSFDGIDIDWEYPGQREGSRPYVDRDNLISLVKEIKEDLGRDVIVSVAVAASKYIAQFAYDIPSLNDFVDFVNLMTYDYFGPWTYVVGHNAPLYHKKTGVKNMRDNFDLSVNASLHFWLKSGMDRSKIMMGIPFYGRTFTLRSSADSEPFSIADGEGPMGNITNIPGVLSFYEACQLIQGRTKQDQLHGETSPLVASKRPRRVWDEDWKAPYFVHDHDWISFEDVDSILEKALFVRNEELGGAMVWSLDHDDISGLCGIKEGRFPLLKTLSKTLRIKENNIHWSLGKQISEKEPAYDDDYREKERSFINSHDSARDHEDYEEFIERADENTSVLGVTALDSSTYARDHVIGSIEQTSQDPTHEASVDSLNPSPLPKILLSSKIYPTTLIRVFSTTPVNQAVYPHLISSSSASPVFVSSPSSITSSERIPEVTSSVWHSRHHSPNDSSTSRSLFLDSFPVSSSISSQNSHLNLLLITLISRSIYMSV
jgi:chitinase